MTMQSININTGTIRLAINNDEKNIIEFCPGDVLFVEKLHRFYRLAMQKAREWERREPEISAQIQSTPTDENGMPESVKPIIEPLEDMNTFMREQIDDLFGKGTASAVFGTAVYRNPAVYIQLIEGVKPYVEEVREKQVARYIAPKPKRKPRKRTK